MITPRTVFLHREDGRIDYAAMRNAATKGKKSSKQLRAEAERTAAAARVASAAAALRAQVQPGFRPPPGRLWSADAAALMLIGPADSIGVSPGAVRILEAMATPGRHDETAVAAAAGLRDVGELREAFQGLAPRLAAHGLRVDRRKAGIRIAKVRVPIKHAPRER